MPVFFFISGYYLNTRRTIPQFIANKARTLLIPYVTTCVVIILIAFCFTILKNFIEIPGNYSVAHWLKASLYAYGARIRSPYVMPAIGALWFLWALFWSTILLRVLLRLPPIARLLIVCILFILGQISIKYVQLPFSIQPAFTALLFVYLGFLLKGARDWIDLLTFEHKTFLICLLISVWIWNTQHFRGLSMVSCKFGNGIIDIVGSVGGGLVAYYVSCLVVRLMPNLSKLLSYFGRFSLILLCVHLIELNVVPIKYLCNQLLGTEIGVWCLFGIKLAFIFICTYLISRSSYGLILFGYKTSTK